MLQPERNPTITQQEHDTAPGERRRGRQRSLGERATSAFTLLPEVETVYEFERDYLRSRIIGQDAAIDAIISALDRSGVRTEGDNRPIASLAFLGPTGVGKTETAKALSEVLTKYTPNLIRIDCSNFSHGHEVASLIGSPPGFVGREQRPILSPDRVEDDAVILFDEIEKGSPQLTNLLLQIMDNGQLELNNGQIVSFKDSVLIMTSNLGAKEMAREAGGSRTGFGAGVEASVDATVVESAALKGFRDFFNPEFVNRLDNMVVFHPLDEPALHEVLEVKLGGMNRTYADDFGAVVSLSERTREHIVAQALEQKSYGVRPLVRSLERDVASTFGRYVANGSIEEGTEVYVYHRDELGEELSSRHKGELVFATRPDSRIKRKIIAPPAPDPAEEVLVVSTELVKVDDEHEDPEEE